MLTALESINSLTLLERVGQLFFIGLPGPEVDETTGRLLTDVAPGGVCLFARNIKDSSQTRHLLEQLRELSPVKPFLSIDQEGGMVDRLRRLLGPAPAVNKINTQQDAREMGEIISVALRILGFNMDFAPVVDVMDAQRSSTSNGLYSRTFGRSAEQVVQLAEAFLGALENDGIGGCLKHFPGLGASEVDSHDELPVVGVAQTEFEEKDLFPYRKMLAENDSRTVMVAHACYPNLDLQETDRSGKLLPSSLSRSVISGLLRGELGFSGLVLTDDLEMGAILKSYGIGQACKMAISAGADMLAICAGLDSIYDGFNAVSAAVSSGEITEERLNESLVRIAAAKDKLSEPIAFDETRLGSLSDRIAKINARLN
ncbi:MAG: glycoside hydrolase family 3 N-terminal domain-containing protein [Acidobacteriota bacterium]